MGNLSSKIGGKQIRERAVGKFGIGTRNSRALVDFAAKDNIKNNIHFSVNRKIGNGHGKAQAENELKMPVKFDSNGQSKYCTRY